MASYKSPAYQVPVGIDSFQKLVDPERKNLFVDRSLWVKQIFEEGSDVLAFHTFRRSGKSLTASMLEYFFAPQVGPIQTHGLFDHLKLGQEEPEFVAEHQGQYPVVALTLKNAQAPTFDGTVLKLFEMVRDLYIQFFYLASSEHLTSDQKEDVIFYSSKENVRLELSEEWEKSFLTLATLLQKHHQKRVIVIIDEYDSPMVGGARHGYLPQITAFMREWLGSALKSNKALEKGVLFGILRFSKESFLSGLNNIEIYTLLDPIAYQPYFGFTEEEVLNLLSQANISLDCLGEIKKGYNGYLVGDYSLYNPLSVMSYIKRGGHGLKTFWVNTGSDELQRRALLHASNDVKDKFRLLIAGEGSVFIRINEVVRFEDMDKDSNVFWALLYAAGYLTAAEPLKNHRSHYEGQVKIPNDEIKGLYVDVFANWLEQELLQSQSPLEPFYDALRLGKTEKLGQWLGDFLLTHTSHYNLTQESSYHTLLLGLTAGLLDSHHVWSEAESGDGRPDLMLIPRTGQNNDLAWVFEFKRLPKPKNKPDVSDEEEEKSLLELAQTALDQITENRYTAKLADFPHVKRILKMGLGFGGKSVRWKHLLLF